MSYQSGGIDHKLLLSTAGLLFILMVAPACFAAAELIHHDLRVELYPDEHRFRAVDTITLPVSSSAETELVLHAGLKPRSSSFGVQMERTHEESGTVPLESFKIVLPRGQKSFTVEYGGLIHHPLTQFGKEQARGGQETPGIISGEGVYFSGSSAWYPIFAGEMVSFSLAVKLPAGWDGVSQGGRSAHARSEDTSSVRWECREPQVEIYLIAAPFTEYTRQAGRVETMAFLRTPDEKLANRYLTATGAYLAMYENLIGPYPYSKFALVENFWETGFGMPSFTLLGPKVIRLPFILNTSYPHEILHNWWGNGVYPEYEKGNWSEGLTAYLSDHLMREQAGDAAEYRQSTLQKYADYVLSGRDFPLSRFVSRHGTSSEAVGYGKSLMFFHMLRLELGDKGFVEGLRRFYSSRKFRHASFDDLRKSMEQATGRSLEPMFDQWVKREGAPEIKVSGIEVGRKGGEYVLSGLLEQTRLGEAYRLKVPVAVTMEGRDTAFQAVVPLHHKSRHIRFTLPARPLRLDVDPEFDVFRRLDREETPPALTQAFGAKRLLILLPFSATPRLLDAYRELAGALSRSGPDDVQIRLDTDLEELPADRAVVLLGWENLFVKRIDSALSGYGVRMDDESVRLDDREMKRESHSVVLTARLPKNKDHSLVWIASDLPPALPGLGRKLPHYHKYSYLGFEGQEPENVVKGRWPVMGSPMTVLIPQDGKGANGIEPAKLQPRKPLAAADTAFLYKMGNTEIALQHGYIATWITEPFITGGGAHRRRPGHGAFLAPHQERTMRESMLQGRQRVLRISVPSGS